MARAIFLTINNQCRNLARVDEEVRVVVCSLLRLLSFYTYLYLTYHIIFTNTLSHTQ